MTQAYSRVSVATVVRPRLLMRVLVVMALCLFPFSASALSTTIKLDATTVLGEAADFRFEVSVEAYTEGENVVYSVTNTGADWPRYTLVGVFPAFGLGVIANQRVKLKTGESYTLRGVLHNSYAAGLEFRIKAKWINQDFVMRGTPVARPSVEQARGQ